MPQQRGNPGTLDLPWYGIGFIDAIKRAFIKAFRSDGRASRSEYWWFVLLETIVMVAYYVVAIMSMFAISDSSTGLSLVSTLVTSIAGITSLAMVVVGLSLSIRRLHDTGQPGWLLLVSLIPFGSIVLLIFMLTGPKPEGQRFDRNHGFTQLAYSGGLAGQQGYGYQPGYGMQGYGAQPPGYGGQPYGFDQRP